MVAMLRRELLVVMASSADCPHVCRYLGVAKKGRAFCIVMQLYKESLAAFIVRQPGSKLTLSQAMAFACAIARGLDELHRCHIIACDLKPDNVLLSDTGHAVLADFGIARCVNATVGSVRPTQTGGTFNYMAPEQMGDDGDGDEGAGGGGGGSAGVNSKTDVWALACTLVHMLTGQPPLSGRNAMQIMMAVNVKRTPHALPPGIPVGLSDLLRSCLNYDPRRRPSPKAILETLTAVMDQQEREQGDLVESLKLQLAQATAAAAAAAAAAAGAAAAAAAAAPYTSGAPSSDADDSAQHAQSSSGYRSTPPCRTTCARPAHAAAPHAQQHANSQQQQQQPPAAPIDHTYAVQQPSVQQASGQHRRNRSAAAGRGSAAVAQVAEDNAAPAAQRGTEPRHPASVTATPGERNVPAAQRVTYRLVGSEGAVTREAVAAAGASDPASVVPGVVSRPPGSPAPGCGDSPAGDAAATPRDPGAPLNDLGAVRSAAPVLLPQRSRTPAAAGSHAAAAGSSAAFSSAAAAAAAATAGPTIRPLAGASSVAWSSSSLDARVVSDPSPASDSPLLHWPVFHPPLHTSLDALVHHMNACSVPTTFDLGGREVLHTAAGAGHASRGGWGGMRDGKVTISSSVGLRVRNGSLRLAEGPRPNGPCLCVTGRSVTLESVTVCGGDVGVMVVGGGQVNMVDCEVRGACSGLCVRGGHRGDDSGVFSTCSARELRVVGCVTNGLYVGDGGRVRLSGGGFCGGGADGIFLLGESSYLKATGVSCTGNGGFGLQLGAGANAGMTRCVLSENRQGSVHVGDVRSVAKLSMCKLDWKPSTTNGGHVEIVQARGGGGGGG
ncbi:MAG: hypothetical protein WDW38_001197 [Sanguina aurantia]